MCLIMYQVVNHYVFYFFNMPNLTLCPPMYLKKLKAWAVESFVQWHNANKQKHP